MTRRQKGKILTKKTAHYSTHLTLGLSEQIKRSVTPIILISADNAMLTVFYYVVDIRSENYFNNLFTLGMDSIKGSVQITESVS